jgi:hypothetical protein
MLHRALLFIVAAHAHGALGVELPLLEASGAATGRIVIAGKFSPGSDGALVQDAGGLSAPVLLLGGPTPHVVETHQASSGKPIAGTAAVGIVPSVSSSMEALCLIQQVGSGATLSCAAFSPPTKALELVTNGAVGVCSLGTNSLVVLSTPTPACPAVKPFKFVSADAQGNLRVTRETDLGVTAKPGYAWRAVGAGQLSGNTVFAAVRSSADDTALEVFAFSASDASAPTQLASAALTASVPLPVIGVSVADIYADAPPTYSSRMPTRRQTCFGSPRALRPSTAPPQPASTPSAQVHDGSPSRRARGSARRARASLASHSCSDCARRRQRPPRGPPTPASTSACCSLDGRSTGYAGVPRSAVCARCRSSRAPSKTMGPTWPTSPRR